MSEENKWKSPESAPKDGNPILADVGYPWAVVAAKPDHHIRYARAWMLRQSDGMTTTAKLACEREMDAAQELFTWEEFRDFKLTLDGFVDFWNRWASFVSRH